MSSHTTAGYKMIGQGSSSWSMLQPCSKLLLLFVSFLVIVAFSLGRYTATPKSNILSLLESSHTFIYNRTFAEGSSDADVLWEALFPLQHGFFTHPTIAPQRSTFSVYHYLHCLNGIRQGYWLIHDMAIAGAQLNESSVPFMLSPPHIRHCIDLLRHSLMCNPDLTVEVKDDSLGGVRGFGEQHQCIDWSELKQWTTTWESSR